jgi:pyridoxine 5-phosphate synthase
MIKLGVNIDHVATVRQARGGVEPEPVAAASVAELAGAHGITVHLREDRRHIADRDVIILRETVHTKLNLEMANTAGIVDIALATKPDQCTLVPEKREELTTEGGLDVKSNLKAITETVERMHQAGIVVSLFVDPDQVQLQASADSGAEFVELHTGMYANARGEKAQEDELQKLIDGAEFGIENGLRIIAGHGLNYINVAGMFRIPKVEELNIGHSIIARAVFVGLDQAVREMVELLKSE